MPWGATCISSAVRGNAYSRSNLYARGSSASQRADDQCGEPQGSDPCLQVDNKILGCDRGESEGDLPTTRLDLSQLSMSSLGPIPQRLVLPTFPCVDYISRGNTGGLHSRPPSSNVVKPMTSGDGLVASFSGLARQKGCRWPATNPGSACLGP